MRDGSPATTWFNGRKYTRLDTGYYRASSRPATYLHRDVWEQAHGPIPPGMEVHHRPPAPGVDPAPKWTTYAGDLQLVTHVEHMRLHPTYRRAAPDPAAIPVGTSWATVQEVAAATGRKPESVRHRCRTGALVSRWSGGRWMIAVRDRRPLLGSYLSET